ncbi:hypothetical protein DXG03_000567 [Asterophora parasitica]|uniref:SANT domain-containing protein n=1 Tax=Asterophora parasitica TaxID=117018 RepID=A0A9P7G5T0_9AGAR|nr:hypothetical protein DXG03_000567 [Asterophora parasitica]
MQKLDPAPKSAGLPPRPTDPLAMKASTVFGRANESAAALPSPPSPKRPTASVPSQKPAGINGALKPAALAKPAALKAESRDVQIFEKAGRSSIATPRAIVPAPPATLSEKVPATQNDTSVMEQPHERRSDTVPAAAALPTPVPTPQPQRVLDIPQTPTLPESIPTEAKSVREALRIVVMTRMLCDRQTRDERVNPVLLSNWSIAGQFDGPRTSGKPEDVFQEVTEGPREERRLETFGNLKHSLVEKFKERQELLADKVRCLKEEYLSLHERWLAHCAVLDEQSKPTVQGTDPIQPTGRTTRRSAAILGDAVRSDLEMEQIIASLGNDEATDPNYLSLRNLATIPDMISVTHGTIDHYFDDTNHLVENPAGYYGPHTGIHDWTQEEKEIFIDKYAATPKQFGMVAEHLPNKTAAQCVDYYYLHKKRLIDFRKVISQYAPNKRKRRGTGKKKGNMLLADIRQHDAEVQGQLESPKSTGRGRGRKPMLPPEPKEPKKPLPSRRRMQLDLTPSVESATPTPEPESRRRGRRSVAVSISRTVSVALEDAEEEAPDGEERPAKRAKRVRKVKSAAIIEDDDDDDGTPDPKLTEQTESISRRKSASSSSQWSEEDKSLFLTLLGQHGDDFKRIAASMPNKANMDDLDLEKVAAGAPKRSPTPDIPSETFLPVPAFPVSTHEPSMSPADPMACLAPGPAPVSANEAGPSRPARDVDMRWGESHYASASNSRPISPSHMRSTYPYSVPSGRPPPPAHYPPHPAYVPPPPVPYTYPPYSASHYPHYDTGYDHSRMQYTHPYPMPDPMSGQHVHARRMSGAMPPGGVPLGRARENPYPILPPGPPPYHYSLESSS